MTNTAETITSILKNEYLGIGAIGADAIWAMWQDFAEGKHADWLTETGVSDQELAQELTAITLLIVRDGNVRKMNTPTGWVEK